MARYRALGAVVGALSVLALGAGCGGGDGRTVVVYSHHDESKTTELDLGEKGESPGDQFTAVEELMDAKGRHLGWDYLNGVRISQDVWRFDISLNLAGGRILLAGAFTDAESEAAEGEKRPFPLTVAGGTGRYRGATGEAEVGYLQRDTNVAKVTIRLNS